MRKLYIILSFCLILSGISVSRAAENPFPDNSKKCKAAQVKGSWYGSYTFIESGSSHAMILEVSSHEACQVKGIIHWPDYFNSKSRFEGQIKDGMLVFAEKELLQGYAMDLSGTYQLQLSQGDSLAGVFFYEEKKSVARLQLLNSRQLPPSQAKKWEKKLADWSARYGTASIGQPISEHTAILDKFKKQQAAQRLPEAPIEIKGRCTLAQLELPLYLVISLPDKTYFEMEFQNLKFMVAKTKNQDWEYNPFEDKLKVTDKNAENAVEENQMSEQFSLAGNPLLKALQQGYQVSQLHQARLDSIDSYRLLLEKENSRKAFYIDTQNYQLVRIEEDQSIKLLLNYRQQEGFQLPTLYYQISEKEVNKFVFQQVAANPAIGDELFEIPEELLEKQHKSPVAESDQHNNAGNTKFEEGRYQEAILDYDRAIRLAPNRVVYYLNRGKAKKENEDYYGAISDFDQALKLDPKNAEAHNWKGVAKYMIGDHGNALKDFARSIEADPAYQMGYYNMGYTYMELGEFNKAEEKFAVLISLDSLNPEYLLLNGVSLMNLERTDEAIRSMSRAIEAGDESATAYNYRGVAYFAGQQYPEALEDFRLAAEKDGSDPVKHLNLGNTLYELDQYKEAIVSYEKALSLAEEKDEILHRLGLCYYQQDAFGNAQDYFSKAIEENPRNATYYDHRALARNGLMNYAGAIEDYTTSIALYPDDPEVYFQRGLLNVNIHSKFEGCKDLQKAHHMGHEGAGEMLKKHCSVEVSNMDK